IERSRIKLGKRNRMFGKNGQPRRCHLGKTATHENTPLPLSLRIDIDNAGAKRRHGGRMACHHAEIAFLAGHGHHVNLLRQEEPLWRHKLEMQLLSHGYLPDPSRYAASLARRSALAIASS